jgi:hypothetical protein
LNGEHPAELGVEMQMEACFDAGADDCAFKTDITVTNCDGFYVYHLIDTPRDYFSRYCAFIDE